MCVFLPKFFLRATPIHIAARGSLDSWLRPCSQSSPSIAAKTFARSATLRMESNDRFHGGSMTDGIGIKRIPLESFNSYVDEVSAKVDKIQQRMNNVEQLHSTLLKKSPRNSKSGFLEEQDQDASKKGATASNTAHRLLHRYNNILSQVRRKKEKDKRLSSKAYHEQTARDINRELNELSLQLENLREKVLQQCRKMSTEEKKKLLSALSRLEPNDLNIALEIVATNNPGFEPLAAEVDLNLDYQSEATLWRLKFFVQRALGTHVTGSIVTNGDISNAAQIAAPATTKDNARTTPICKKQKR